MADAGALGPQLYKMAREIEGDLGRAMLKRVGDKLVPSIDQAVRATPVKSGRSLRDQSMSGFQSKGRAVTITGGYRVDRAGELDMVPATAGGVSGRAVLNPGPMRILTDGRQAYAAGDQRQSGTYTSKKTGVSKTKYRKVSRTVGAQRGKGTWRAAEARMERDAPAVVEVEVADLWTKKAGGIRG